MLYQINSIVLQFYLIHKFVKDAVQICKNIATTYCVFQLIHTRCRNLIDIMSTQPD